MKNAHTRASKLIGVNTVFVFLHQVCDEYFTKMRRQVYQTPKSYLSFLQLYKAMYKEKINELKVPKKYPIADLCNRLLGVLGWSKASRFASLQLWLCVFLALVVSCCDIPSSV